MSIKLHPRYGTVNICNLLMVTPLNTDVIYGWSLGMKHAPMMLKEKMRRIRGGIEDGRKEEDHSHSHWDEKTVSYD